MLSNINRNGSEAFSKMFVAFDYDSLHFDVMWHRIATFQTIKDVAMHYHSTFELHYVYSGDCSVILKDGKAYNASAGMLYINKPYQAHRQIIGENYIEYCINIGIRKNNTDSSELGNLADILSTGEIIMLDHCDYFIAPFEDSLKNAYERGYASIEKIRLNILSILLTTAQRISNGRNDAVLTCQAKPKRRTSDRYIDDINHYINNNIYQKITVKSIAASCHISEKQVLRLLQQKYGITAKQYIDQKKCEMAVELLSSSTFNITELSLMLSYSNPVTFIRCFQRTVGYTPHEFKNNIFSSD